jgi:hypothetical protein
VSIPPAWPRTLDFFGTPLVIEPLPRQFSSDAGLLPIRQFDQRIRLTRAFAGALDDPRDHDLTEHTFAEMARARVYAARREKREKATHLFFLDEFAGGG